jgi:hypothetical protein
MVVIEWRMAKDGDLVPVWLMDQYNDVVDFYTSKHLEYLL